MDNNYYEVTEADFILTEEEMWEEGMRGLMEYETEDLPLEAIECLFKRQDWSWELNDMPWYEKSFYWLKTLICLCFRRLRGAYLDDYFPVLTWNEVSNGEIGGTSWQCCWVGNGIFKNWQVQIGNDGT